MTWLPIVEIPGNFQVPPLALDCEKKVQIKPLQVRLKGYRDCGFCGFLFINSLKYNFLCFGNNGVYHRGEETFCLLSHGDIGRML